MFVPHDLASLPTLAVGSSKQHLHTALEILARLPPDVVDESVEPNVSYLYGRIIFEAATDLKDKAGAALAKGA